MTNKGIAGFPTAPVAMFAAPFPPSGNYFYTASDAAAGASSALGVGTLRLVPWLVPTQVTINRLGGEVTSGGDSGSKFRIGIYADNGGCYPGPLVVDAGTIAGDSATVQELTINNLILLPGLYWVGGAVQVVSVTQPTVKTLSGWIPPVRVSAGTSTPSAGQTVFGVSQASVTGALPSVFSSTLSVIGTAPRTFAKVA